MFEYHGVKLTWLGHDGFRIEVGKTIYLDPFKIEGGPKADIVLVSHEHFDHCNLDDFEEGRYSKHGDCGTLTVQE